MSELKQATVEVNGKEYKVRIACDDASRSQGLQNVSDLPEDEGMLFIFDEPETAAFWMKDTIIPLDIIFIDEYGDVKTVYYGEPLNENLVEVDDIKYVLEVNSDSGIQAGDEVDLSEVEDYDMEDEDEESDEPVMSVLDPNGDSQMDLYGGERIFSRPNTKTLIRLSKRAWKSKDEKDYKALGKRVFKYLDVQNNKKEDYVQLPE